MATKSRQAVFSAGTGQENLSFKLSANQAKRVGQVLKGAKPATSQASSKSKASKKHAA
jgi:hypothetical protein